jgi:hypothetical protein
MLDAVTSSAMTAGFAKVETDKVSPVSRSVSDIAPVKNTASQAPYYSPYVFVDSNYDKAILAIRDNNTGSVTQQYPSPNQIRAYQRAQAALTSDPAVFTPEQATEVKQELPDSLKPVAEKAAVAQQQASLSGVGDNALPGQTAVNGASSGSNVAPSASKVLLDA